MNLDEMITRTDAAFDTYAGRVPAATMQGIREMASVGERGEAVSELLATLAKHKAPVTLAERDELRALAEATGEGREYLEGLTIRE